jgi:hypothetical protein
MDVGSSHANAARLLGSTDQARGCLADTPPQIGESRFPFTGPRQRRSRAAQRTHGLAAVNGLAGDASSERVAVAFIGRLNCGAGKHDNEKRRSGYQASE